MKQVKVDRRVKEVTDEIHYEGHLKIDNIKIDFEFRATVPISNVVGPITEKKAGLRTLFSLTVKNGNGEKVILDDEAHNLSIVICYDAIVQARTLKGRIANGDTIIVTDGISCSKVQPLAETSIAIFHEKFGPKPATKKPKT